MQTENPVFIVGYPRSGTTMLWKILNKHPSFSSENSEKSKTIEAPLVLESQIISKIRDDSSIYKRIYLNGRYPYWMNIFGGDRIKFKAFLNDIKYIKKIQRISNFLERKGFFDYIIRNSNLKKKFIWNNSGDKKIFRQFLIRAAQGREANRILEKTPSNFYHVDKILRSFKQPKIIFIYRHPVDVFASLKRRLKNIHNEHMANTSWLEISKNDFIQQYKVSMDIMKKNIKRFPDKINAVKYENLTSNPKKEMKRIFNFINEPFFDKCIEGKLAIRTKSPFYSNVPIKNSNKWKGILNKKQVIFLEGNLKDVMNKLSYEQYVKT